MYPKPIHKKKPAEKVQMIVMQGIRECWVCETNQCLESHHIFGGANRKTSEKYGLKVWLCHQHHNENIPNDPGVHFNKTLMLQLRQEAQARFETVYSRDKFMQEFGRCYL